MAWVAFLPDDVRSLGVSGRDLACFALLDGSDRRSVRAKLSSSSVRLLFLCLAHTTSFSVTRHLDYFLKVAWYPWYPFIQRLVKAQWPDLEAAKY
jgi:hypothetical protein